MAGGWQILEVGGYCVGRCWWGGHADSSWMAVDGACERVEVVTGGWETRS